MADVFISYKREDRRAAERLSIVLEQLGFNVWWDFDLICGDQFRRAIEKIIDECAATVVLWSVLARESTFVVDEATYAREQGKLCPARIDECRLPLGFGGDHVVDLRDWDGEIGHEGLQALLRALELKTGKKARLGAPARDAEDEARYAEMEAFKAAQAAQNVSALRSFLRDYPEGAFSKFVRGQLAEMETVAPAVAVAAPAAPPELTLSPPPAPPPPPLPQAELPLAPPASPPRDLRAATPPLGSPRGFARRLPLPLIAAGGALAAAFALAAVLWRQEQPSTSPAQVVTKNDAAEVDDQASVSESEPARDPSADFGGDGADAAPTPSGDGADGMRREAHAPPPASSSAQSTPPPSTQTQSFAPYDLAQLHPDVRRAVEAARDAERRAEVAAFRAREVVARAEDAAGRARRGERGYRVREWEAGLRYRYEGAWSDNAANGVGVEVSGLFELTGRYAGEFRLGLQSGLGVESHAGRVLYEGEFEAGERSGVGIAYYTMDPESRYVGERRDAGTRAGSGVDYDSSGQRYEGEFYGHGVRWDAQGRVMQQGIWHGIRLATPLSR